MEEGLIFVLFAVLFFFLTGLFGGLGIYHALNNNKKRAIWFMAVGFMCIIIFIAFSFIGAMQ
ncbi:hypothetical protein [Bacillus sp. FJAT-45037]|uniref:hypothetical protein n=1 Tax=Bacillus sp. FJAT-45037 TaxID=2011007 RepID=UPI000C245107|nr:hypothetical protein [Bacillus sp. FJAT-45037]